jgi:hypothetical protein
MEYQNKPLINKTISIVSHQLKSGVRNPSIKFVEIVDGENNKFTFFPKKQDGSPTKAFEYYQKNKGSWDDALIDNFQPKVEIGFEEKEYTYQDKTGQTRVGKRRGIKFFKAIPTAGQAVGDQRQAEYRIPDITPDGIPIIEPTNPTKKPKMEEFEDTVENVPFGAPDVEFPGEDELGY